MNHEPIGIVSTGIYLPEQRMTGEKIAALSGLPLAVVEQKMGIKEKPIPGEEDHTCQMGIYAAKKAMEKGGVLPEELDLVIYIGEEYKEYPLWTASIKLQQEIGAIRAWAFDVALRCCTTIMALKLAKDMMIADPSIRTALLAGGYRNVDLIDYSNPRTRFMYNLSAGGGAIILQKGYRCNELLESHLITDGSFSEDVIVRVGGTKQPIFPAAIEKRLHYLDVTDPEGMKRRLEEKSMNHFLSVIRKSLEKSGLSEKDIDYLGILHMKKSAHDFVLNELGLSEEQSIYLDRYGHVGQFDQILSLELGLADGKIKNGDIVVLVSAGIGYAWGASTIRWGRE
ncbi:3-oxoacyl-ACP synthase [Anoxybacillus sp. LAT_35]|uniref:3-oxoacyl-ACP synthase n=1 Tax=Anoxybacillus kestanbolensis TaxID=227476 RepID=A0A1V3FQP6_9BACL|nr:MULTISPECIES: 3-oxoacyl-ACP synthase [Anoxybacillus]MCG5025582.1 3-oxoacyl-ACP synthase [Anoxybacillus flavithermus]MCG6196545.1 3-oxoacyl-ACP synthase [Anoxybacillus sp. LAT_38]MCG3083949.1 3-oxoacyl-ACP synthase [Anoxybacillus sp. LAT27]MCG6172294.1 3-oxoacyl-ACP synthase [Anoxybacillus sp. LAT_11]MCG6175513.1 3-oxoacyl-ACP synthase [Anoxybacillus sp. LAT_31]